MPAGSMVYRTIYFLPVVLSPVVIGIIWSWIYNPLFGLLNTGLRDDRPGLLGHRLARRVRRPLSMRSW